MKIRTSLFHLVAMTSLFIGQASAQVIWEAYNDHRGGLSTAANTTIWEMRGAGNSGALKDFSTGADLPATLVIEEDGTATDDFGANGTPNAGTPADLFFAEKCTIGGVGADGIPGVRSSGATVLRLRFTGLDPTKRYKFRGTTCRGNAAYVDRWSLFKIVEVDSATAAHVDGSLDMNLFTSVTFPDGGIMADEVALNSGNNLDGSLVGWDNINPGADGTFAIEARQYIGTAPFGIPSAAAYGYGLNVMYLAAVEPSTGGLGTITNVSSSGGNIIIEWTGAGTLQSSDNLNAWTDLLTATSPYSTSMAPGRKSFRLRE